MNELRYFRRDTGSPTETGWTIELSGPAHPFHRSFNPGSGDGTVGIGFDDLKVIEAGQFLQAVVSGVQGPPSFEDAAAVARVQQAIAASWDSGGWETVRATGDRSPSRGLDPRVAAASVSAIRAFTSFVTRASGSSASAVNRIVPLEVSYGVQLVGDRLHHGRTMT